MTERGKPGNISLLLLRPRIHGEEGGGEGGRGGGGCISRAAAAPPPPHIVTG